MQPIHSCSVRPSNLCSGILCLSISPVNADSHANAQLRTKSIIHFFSRYLRVRLPRHAAPLKIPSMFTQPPSTTARSQPIMTASSRQPVALTVHTSLSLACPSTARSRRYARPSSWRRCSAASVGGGGEPEASGVGVGTVEERPRLQNMPEKKPPSQPTASSTKRRMGERSSGWGEEDDLEARAMRS